MKREAARVDSARWLRFAREDLAVAGRLFPETPRHSCTLAQQAAEKALKAVLIAGEQGFPKTHDLDDLRNLVPDSWRFKTEFSDLSWLSGWTIEGRYPGDWPEASVEDARTAIAQVEKLLAAITAEWPV